MSNAANVTLESKQKIVDEHFWFTATTLAVNGLLITTAFPGLSRLFVGLFSSVITLYAVILILHRAAAHAGRLPDHSGVAEHEKQFADKRRETGERLRCLPKEFGFVVVDFSGAFFYLILVVSSCVGVWLANPSCGHLPR